MSYTRKDVIDQGRSHQLRLINTQMETVQLLLDETVSKATQLPAGEQQLLLIGECKELLLQLAELVWQGTELKMQLEGSLPDWSISDALHHPVQQRYALVRMDGITDDQHIIIESFDSEGNGEIERISIFDFEPSQWDVIERHIYDAQLQQMLSSRSITWNQTVTC